MKCKDCKYLAGKTIKKSALSHAWLGDATTEFEIVCRKQDDKITDPNNENICKEFITNHTKK